MNWREEIKYPLLRSASFVLRNLYRLGYLELYPSRTITSTYYDTLDNYLLSKGRMDVFPRYYVRTRSYNSNPASLELKIREGNQSTKVRSADPGNEIWAFPDPVLFLLKELGLSAPFPLLPKVTISYCRYYLEHPRYPDVVVTLDDELLCSPFPGIPDVVFSKGVLELKFNNQMGAMPPLPPGISCAQGHSKIQLAFNSVYRGWPG
ncbi:MAG: hypothetical protein H3C47_01450 [Candidatus Cloacimonetes bacterium]|nr:hypothetical protein [Candidatus Cloacimonadota bacterium]